MEFTSTVELANWALNFELLKQVKNVPVMTHIQLNGICVQQFVLSGLANITNKILQELVENIFLEPLAKKGNTLLIRSGSDLQPTLVQTEAVRIGFTINSAMPERSFKTLLLDRYSLFSRSAWVSRPAWHHQDISMMVMMMWQGDERGVAKQRLKISSSETNGKGGDGGSRGRSCCKKLEKQEKRPRGGFIP